MNEIGKFRLRALCWAVLGLVGFSSIPTMADVRGRCVPSPPCFCNQECFRCGPGGCGSSSGTSSPTIDHEAERRRQEAEAAERARQAEELRKKEEAKFIQERDEAAKGLKGSPGTNTDELKGASGMDSHGLKGVESKVGRALKGAEGDSREAAMLQKEASNEKARRGFDRTSSDHGSLVVPGISGKNPAARSSLASHIDPQALKDPNVQKSLAVHEHFEKVQAEIRQKIAETRQKQKSGAGDKAALDAHLKTLEHQNKDMENQKTKAKEEVKKTVRNLGYEWNEAGTTAARGKPGNKQ